MNAAVTVGTKVVTVARDGAKTARINDHMAVPVFCTALYEAKARQKDGVVTWRRVRSLGDSTSGRGVTGAMVARAEAAAQRLGVMYGRGIRHGQRVNA